MLLGQRWRSESFLWLRRFNEVVRDSLMNRIPRVVTLCTFCFRAQKALQLNVSPETCPHGCLCGLSWRRHLIWAGRWRELDYESSTRVHRVSVPEKYYALMCSMVIPCKNVVYGREDRRIFKMKRHPPDPSPNSGDWSGQRPLQQIQANVTLERFRLKDVHGHST